MQNGIEYQGQILKPLRESSYYLLIMKQLKKENFLSFEAGIFQQNPGIANRSVQGNFAYSQLGFLGAKSYL